MIVPIKEPRTFNVIRLENDFQNTLHSTFKTVPKHMRDKVNQIARARVCHGSNVSWNSNNEKNRQRTLGTIRNVT